MTIIATFSILRLHRTYIVETIEYYLSEKLSFENFAEEVECSKWRLEWIISSLEEEKMNEVKNLIEKGEKIYEK